MISKKIPFLMTCSTILLSGCLSNPDQRDQYVKFQHKLLANPASLDTNFKENIKNHKIIMAVVDTEIDHRHPILQKNLHPTLDKKGNIASLGKDYLALDDFASYRTVNTNLYEFDALS